MLKHLRLWLPAAALVALIASGCQLLTAQIAVSFDFQSHGYDPVIVTAPTALVGVPVDLNVVTAYKDHKKDLKDVVDLAIVGTLTNLDTANEVNIQIVMVPRPGALLFSETNVRNAGGVTVWGPAKIAAGSSRKIDWNESARLFTGRRKLMDEVRGDGRFDLYLTGDNGYNFKLTKGVLIAIIAAGK